MEDESIHLYDLLKQLSSKNKFERRQAKQGLLAAKEEAIPYLIGGMLDADPTTQSLCAEILYQLDGPQSPKYLAKQLENDSSVERWDAAEKLVHYDRAGLIAVLEVLQHKFDSPRVREGAHHVLRKLHERHRLRPEERHVLEAFDQIEASSVIPWKAQEALMAIEGVRKGRI